jgi:large subunit ribosomal protein L31e
MFWQSSTPVLPTWVWQNGSHKEERQEEGAILPSTRYTIYIHKHIHGVGFKKCASWVLKAIWKFAMKKMGTPDVCVDTRLNKTFWTKGTWNVSDHI